MEHEQNSFEDLFFWHLDIIDVLPQAKILRLHAMDLQMCNCKPFAFFRKRHAQDPKKSRSANRHSTKYYYSPTLLGFPQTLVW